MNTHAYITLVCAALAVIAAVSLLFSVRARRIAYLTKLRQDKGFVCYHGYSVVDCTICKEGETFKLFSRAERRRTERHNQKVVKRLKRRGVKLPWQ